MNEFPTREMAVTRLLVVSDISRSKKWYEDVLGAGGGPTEDKPSLYFVPPDNPDRVSAELIFRVPNCRRAYELPKERGISEVNR